MDQNGDGFGHLQTLFIQLSVNKEFFLDRKSEKYTQQIVQCYSLFSTVETLDLEAAIEKSVDMKARKNVLYKVNIFLTDKRCI